MKRSKLEEELKRISEELRDSKTIPNAIFVARKYGEYRTEVLSCNTKVMGKFTGRDYLGKEINIEYRDGLTMFGGGDIKIIYDRQIVLEGDRYAFGTNKINPLKVEDFFIELYKPGKWQQQLSILAEKGPKQEEKEEKKIIKDPIISESDLLEYKKKFPIKGR